MSRDVTYQQLEKEHQDAEYLRIAKEKLAQWAPPEHQQQDAYWADVLTLIHTIIEKTRPSGIEEQIGVDNATSSRWNAYRQRLRSNSAVSQCSRSAIESNRRPSRQSCKLALTGASAGISFRS